MDDVVVAAYKQARAHHEIIYRIVKTLRSKIEVCTSLPELADYVYALRETIRYTEDSRKECQQLKELTEKIGCALWAQSENGEPIRTEHCTGTPDVKMMASIPKRSTKPQEYAKLMDYLGVPPELWSDHEIVRPYWPGFVEHLSDLTRNGKPIPPGIDPDRTYPVYKMAIRSKKGVDE